jgi:uncharacterized membrane protein YgcG
MKKLILSLSIATLGFIPASAQDSDSTGLPGDNFDLQGVLELFKNSESLEAFEKALNSESNEVNNLDVDEDGQVDYVKVIDHLDSGAHAITLQVDVNDKESQDIAVIEIDKTGDETAELQIVGDEEMYGKDYIVEPEDETANTQDGKFTSGFAPPVVIVNVWGWRPIRHIYAPTYVVWVSPWRYRVYPPYWKPWRPVAWRVHHARVVRYHHHCRVVHVHRVHRAHRIAHRHHATSPHYHQRNAARRNNAGNVQRNNGGAKKNQGGGNRGGQRGGGGNRGGGGGRHR